MNLNFKSETWRTDMFLRNRSILNVSVHQNHRCIGADTYIPHIYADRSNWLL